MLFLCLEPISSLPLYLEFKLCANDPPALQDTAFFPNNFEEMLKYNNLHIFIMICTYLTHTTHSNIRVEYQCRGNSMNFEVPQIL